MIEAHSDTSALGLYVHFPWCIKKCPYCDFNSHPLKAGTDQVVYLDALLGDWRQQYGSFGKARIAQTNTGQIESIFFGGGTPSLFKPQHLARLLEEVPHQGAEITLEVNPGTAEYHRFKDYQDAGISRLSIGAQSFSNAQLARLGRVHQRDETISAVAKARQAGFQRYEVSAFARTGYQCQHNLVYWSFGDYMGIGAGAHGKITQGPKIYRTQRPSQPRLYQQDSQTTKLTEIPQTQRTIEFMMNALRLLDGVTQQSFAERTQLPWQSVSQVWQELVDLELVRHDRCATTALGLRYLDSVLERFLEA